MQKNQFKVFPGRKSFKFVGGKIKKMLKSLIFSWENIFAGERVRRIKNSSKYVTS